MRRAPKQSFAYQLHVAEPKSAYLKRPPLVTDASLIAAALFGEKGRAEAVALLRGRTLHAPHLLDYEIASVGLKKLRSEKISHEIVAAVLQAYVRLPIERHAVNAETIAAIAERYGLTAYDAAYLHIAEQLTAPLATFDDRLAAAARAHLSRDQEVHETE